MKDYTSFYHAMFLNEESNFDGEDQRLYKVKQ